MKRWTFTTCAIGALIASALGLTALIINVVTGNEPFQILLPIGIAAWVLGGALSARAHILWIGKS